MSIVKIIQLRDLSDKRGALSVVESEVDVPFKIERVYYLFNTDIGIERGFHAHKELVQMAVCVKGSCNILLDDGVCKEEVNMNSPLKGLIIDKMVWHKMSRFSSDCVLVVFASNHYNESDYIRDYDTFLRMVESE